MSIENKELHYVKVPENHIVIDFDKNLEEVSKRSETYAAVSKSLAGIHLHYILNNFKNIDETITKIENLTGYSLDDLLEKFAAGWELKPPEKDYTFTDIMSDILRDKW